MGQNDNFGLRHVKKENDNIVISSTFHLWLVSAAIVLAFLVVIGLISIGDAKCLSGNVG